MPARILSYFRNLFRKRSVEQALDDELRSSVELLTQEKMKQGLSQSAARREALIELGGIEQVKEEARDVRAGRILEDFARDIRFAFRSLARSPSFTVIAVLTLALGIGANTAIFSVVEGVLLRPLPYPQADRLVQVAQTAPGLHYGFISTAPFLYFTYRDDSRTFEDIGLYQTDAANVAGSGEPQRLRALRVTDGLLPVLGVPPLLGRWFSQADVKPGSPNTVMLTYGYWRRSFGGNRSVIGKTLDVNGMPRTVIGVMPERFRFLDQTNLAMLLPLKLNRAKTHLGNFSFMGIARLKPRVTLAQANADVARVIPIALRSFPAPLGSSLTIFKQARLGPNVQPLKQALIGNVSKILWVLMAGIGLVLVIACANVANLFLVRVEGRGHELAIRGALGASPRQIAGQMWLESLVLALVGGAFGLAFAYGALRILVAMAPAGLPRINAIGIDGHVLLFTLGIALAASLLFGSIPVLKYSGVHLGTGLREAGRSLSASRERHRARNLLVVFQVGLALLLLISSGLMIRTFRALIHVQPGFTAPADVQTFRLFIPNAAVKTPEQVVHVEHAILTRIEALPGVSSVAISHAVPMDGNMWFDSLYVRNRTPVGQELPVRNFYFVSPGFFRTLGTPVIAGRDITWNDISNKRPLAIISENLARKYWKNPADALGKEVRVTNKVEWHQIVGVVGNIYDNGTNKKAPTVVYWPVLSSHLYSPTGSFVNRDVSFLIRSPLAGSQGLMKEIRRSVRSVDPDLPLSGVHTLEFYYAGSMAQTSFTLVMLAIAGIMALLLGSVGLYGVISYMASQRTREIGVRMALGAQKHKILTMVLGQGIRLALTGVAIGIVAAFGVTRFLSSLLYGVRPTDPLTFIAVSLILIAVALLASYIPARRAAKVDPMVALRYE